MKLDHIAPDVLDKVETELLEDETLLWVGHPHPVSAAIGPTLAKDLVPVAMMFFGVLLFTSRAATTGSNAFMFAIPFLMLGFTTWPFLSRFYSARQSTYVLTDRRALIINGNSVKSYGPDDIEFIQRNTRSQGRGDLIFANKLSSYRSNGQRRLKTTPIGFLGIENVHAVEGIMLRAFREDSDPRKPKLKRQLQDETSEAYLDEAAHDEVAYYEQQ